MPSENFTPRSDEEPHPLLLLNMIRIGLSCLNGKQTGFARC